MLVANHSEASLMYSLLKEYIVGVRTDGLVLKCCDLYNVCNSDQIKTLR
jgi:hypothetical protein